MDGFSWLWNIAILATSLLFKWKKNKGLSHFLNPAPLSARSLVGYHICMKEGSFIGISSLKTYFSQRIQRK